MIVFSLSLIHICLHDEVISKAKGFISWEHYVQENTWTDFVLWESEEDANNATTEMCIRDRPQLLLCQPVKFFRIVFKGKDTLISQRGRQEPVSYTHLRHMDKTLQRCGYASLPLCGITMI